MLCLPRAWVTVSSSVVSLGPGPPGLPRGGEQYGFSANRKIGATGDVYLGTAAFNDSLNKVPKITAMDKSLQYVPHWHLQRTAGLPRRSVPTALPCLRPLRQPWDLTCSDGKEMHSDRESWSVTEVVLGWVFDLTPSRRCSLVMPCYQGQGNTTRPILFYLPHKKDLAGDAIYTGALSAGKYSISFPPQPFHSTSDT